MMLVDNKGKKEFWTAGQNTKGLLGQGDDVKESSKFKPMDYDKEKGVARGSEYVLGPLVYDVIIYIWMVNSILI
jgi:hypothetical protein